MKKTPFKPQFYRGAYAYIAIMANNAALTAFDGGNIGRMTTKAEIDECRQLATPSTAADFSRAMLHNLNKVAESIETIDAAITHYNLQ